jgi:small subunit ribosomal protein S2
MVTVPSLRDLLKAGVHFGHKTSRWNPNMKDFIYTAKSGVHVINLEETNKSILDAIDFIKRLVAEGKKVIFVGTKKQASDIVKKAALDCGMPYVAFRWLGGTLTNFEVIKDSVQRFVSDKESFEKGGGDLTKRELSKLREEVSKGEKILGGLVGLEEKPGALILIGSHDEKNAVKEAISAGIPTVAIVDTNADPKLITYPIPANDDATKSIELFANLFATVIRENKKIAVKEEDKK